jgi:hypothetical protein
VIDDESLQHRPTRLGKSSNQVLRAYNPAYAPSGQTPVLGQPVDNDNRILGYDMHVSTMLEHLPGGRSTSLTSSTYSADETGFPISSSFS